jgi:hypothetical protein
MVGNYSVQSTEYLLHQDYYFGLALISNFKGNSNYILKMLVGYINYSS